MDSKYKINSQNQTHLKKKPIKKYVKKRKEKLSKGWSSNNPKYNCLRMIKSALNIYNDAIYHLS